MNPESHSHQPCVAVVLCTWRAGKHLEAQLTSLANQDWPIDIYVFDDASGDETAARARQHPAVTAVIERSENAGFVANFAAGIEHVLALGYNYIALSDQDDHWHVDRIRAGMLELMAAEHDTARCRSTEAMSSGAFPCLVHSDLRMVDADSRELHPSFLGWRGYRIDNCPSLATSLGQCGVMGNTVLFNRALADLALPFPAGLFVHDWWLGLVAELWGNRLFLPRATVDYRLHDHNTSNTLASTRLKACWIPTTHGVRTLLKRDLRLPFKEDSRVVVLEALQADDSAWPALSDDARGTIEHFVAYLRLRGPRHRLLAQTLRSGYIKGGLAHRIRVSFALLATRRYPREPRPR